MATEIEWLKEQSGYTDDELKAFESVMGSAKFVSMLQRIHQASENATKDKAAAEAERLALENRYQNEFIPEMRKVTTDALTAKGEAARLAAQLQQAREYGIVPDPPAQQQQQSAQPQGDQQVRAPGSPDPAEQFRQWSAAQSRAIITLNDLNAEHFKLFKEPLANSQELVDMVQREQTLGHKDFTLQKAWETKFNVPAKRAEIQAAEIQKGKDEYAEQKLKDFKQKMGANPGLVSGQPSRFATYKPSEANAGTEPWKTAPGMKKAANEPWRKAAVSKVAAA